MNPKYKLLCMSFDGDYQLERPLFDSIEAAWDYSHDLGSKWFFYSFHFVVTESGKTIRACPDKLEIFDNLRVKTVRDILKRLSLTDKAKGASIYDYIELLNGRELT